MSTRGRKKAKAVDAEDVEEVQTKKPTTRGKGKRKAEEEDNPTTDNKPDEVLSEDEVVDKLKDTKKKAKVTTGDKDTPASDVDFTLFTKSILDVLTIPNIETIEDNEFEKQFDRIADQLLNNAVVFVNNKPHRLSEIEFYCNGHKHEDVFAHGNEMQKTKGKWYFHKNGKSYKAGSFKGLDLTFGDDKFFGGILLRSIQPIGGDLVEGPSLLVDHVLASTNSPKIEDLVKTFDLSAEYKPATGSKTHPLFVGVSETALSYMPKKEIVKCARVGLTLKNFKDGKEAYFGRNYRYLINPDQIKKGKHYTVVGLHKAGNSAEQIAQKSKSTKAAVAKYIAAYEGGKKKAWKDFIDATLDANDTCEVIGACDAR